MKCNFKKLILLIFMTLLLFGCNTSPQPSAPPTVPQITQQPTTTPPPTMEIEMPTETEQPATEQPATEPVEIIPSTTAKSGESLDIVSPEALYAFYDESVVLPFYLKDSTEFSALFETFIDFYNSSPEFADTTAEAFLSEEIWTSEPLLYEADINNDGVEDFVFAYSGEGSGRYSGLCKAYTIDNDHLVELVIPELLAEEFEGTHFLDVIINGDYTYLRLNVTDRIDLIYSWVGGVATMVFSDQLLADNHYLEADETALSKVISEKYKISERVLALETQGIDYTNSGYSNAEVLLIYYKIKDAILNDDANRLSQLVIYPLMMRQEDGSIAKIYGPDAFVKFYDQLVTPVVKEVVEKSTDDTLFSNWSGIMIGNGSIWFTSHIITIQ